MREYKAEIREKISAYLLSQLNQRAEEKGLPSIVNVETGVTAIPGATGHNPTLYLHVGGRSLSQAFFDTYQVHVGVCFGCATPQDGEHMADLWEDIIEDVFRADRSLGDAALTWTDEPELSSEGEPGMWMVFCMFSVEYDLGGDE